MNKLLALLVLLALPSTALPCGRCGYAVCRYSYSPAYYTAAPYVPPTYNSYDTGLRVTYNISYPYPAVAGATGFGYNAPQYNFLDAALVMNAGSRYLELAQQNAGNGFQQFQQTASLILQGQQGIAETNARTALLESTARLIASTAPTGAGAVSWRVTRDADGRVHFEQDGAGGPGAATATARSGPLNLASIITGRCATCHSASRREGGLDLSDPGKIDRDTALNMLDRITTRDPARRMPKGSSLPPEEINKFFEGFYGQADPAQKSQVPGPEQPPPRNPMAPMVPKQ